MMLFNNLEPTPLFTKGKPKGWQVCASGAEANRLIYSMPYLRRPKAAEPRGMQCKESTVMPSRDER